MSASRKAALGEPLTPCEVAVLRAVAGGDCAKEAAARLGMARKTVEWHVGNAYRKLGARNRMQAIRAATATGHLADLPAGPG